jgi:predicted DsbA family dithiol-disulfide isomerase
MKIDIWSDIVCPFCYIGNAQFNKALEAFAHTDDVDVIHHSFQLMPEAPLHYDGKKSHETLAAAKGIPVAMAEEMNARVGQQGNQEGLVMKMADTKIVNTLNGHRLIHYAATQGKAEETVMALFEAYFTDTIDLSDHDALVAVGVKVGLDEQEIRRVLETEEFATEVIADIQAAAALGIQGVPFFVIDDKYGISGAQGVDVFKSALQKAWHEQHPLQMVSGGEDANICADGNCN